MGKKRPSHIFGRGLCEIDNEIFEFQTAKICKAEDYNEYIREKIEEQKLINNIAAKPIPILPKKVNIAD